MAKEQEILNSEEVTDEDLRKILLSLDALSQQEGVKDKPKNDEELHQWILDSLGVDIPRVAVCPHHDPPFQFLADLFFQRVDAALVMANRGGGKSFLAGIWNFSNLYWEPGIECLAVGAIEIQAKRVYSHIKQFQSKAALDKILSTTISETLWKDGQKMEIVTGSLSSVNGPHSQRVHRDEVELMEKRVYDESLQIERAKTINGREIKSQTLLTSTRKTSTGLMQELIDESEAAEKAGRKPPFKIYRFCIKECIKAQKSCRVAFPDLPEEEKCECHLIQKGEWSEGKPRTFDQVCNGSLVNADGFIPLDDAHKTFMKSSKAMWDAQQECKRPYAEDISLEAYSPEMHEILEYEPDPANGPIYQGIDFGGSNPHAVEWGQVLDFEVEVKGFDGQPKRLPEGSLVLFEEIYIAEIGNVKLADLIIETEREFRQQYPKFRVSGRFADPQAKAARLDFREHDPPLLCSWPTKTRDPNEHFKRLNDRIKDNLFYVVKPRCPMFTEEVTVWNINNNKRTAIDHAVDATLYLASNVFVAEHNRYAQIAEAPVIRGGRKIVKNIPHQFDDSVPGSVKSPLHNQELPASEEWRKNFGKSIV